MLNDFLNATSEEMPPQNLKVINGESLKLNRLQSLGAEQIPKYFIKTYQDFVAFCWDHGGPLGPPRGVGPSRGRGSQLLGGEIEASFHSFF